MAASFSGFLKSKLFKFTVGGDVDEKPSERYVHGEAIANMSDHLRTLVEGEWLESEAGGTHWEDVSDEIFCCFIEFAYTGDYSVPDPRDASRPKVTQPAIVPEAPAVPPTIEDEDFFFTPRRASSKRDKKKITGKSKSAYGVKDKPMNESSSRFNDGPGLSSWPEPYEPGSFHTLSYPLIASRTMFDETREPPAKLLKDKKYANVLSSHASLYILADYRMVDSLKALALYKLHKTLCAFDLRFGDVNDIIQLARKAYTEGGRGSEGVGNVGELRDMVCQFMATNSETLSFEEPFMELLEEGGKFVSDLWKYEVQRKH